MAKPRPTAVLIAGMHRSGTSALAGVLGKLGIPLGDRLLEPAGDNPKGYWEHQDVVAVHEGLLSALGSRWDDVRALPDEWLGTEPALLAARAISDIITRDFSDKPVWAVKDPRLCRVLPLWFDVLKGHETRPVVLFMVRKPSEVSASIEARNYWRPLVGKLLWLRYVTDAVTASRDVVRGVVLYDDLLVDPIATVTKALALLGAAASHDVSEVERDAVSSFVDKSDRHHTSPGSEEPATVFDAIADELYELLVAVAHGIDRWDAIERVIETFNQEWHLSGACIDALADMAAQIHADVQAGKVENLQVTSALKAQIRWSEEAQTKHEALQAENAELSSNLSAQIRWSEEAQAKHEALQAENAELSSNLSAQIRWSDEAQAKLETLQAKNVELSLQLDGMVNAHERVTSDFHTLQQVALEAAQAREDLVAQLRDITVDRDQIAAQLEQARISQVATAAELRKIYSSTSWKSTKPMRAAVRFFRRQTSSAKSSTRKPE